MAKWEKVGNVAVDSGTVWLGDPCYILHLKNGVPKELGTDWDSYHVIIEKAGFFNRHSLNFIRGVLIGTAHGDGNYPVHVRKNSAGGIAEVRIVFED